MACWVNGGTGSPRVSTPKVTDAAIESLRLDQSLGRWNNLRHTIFGLVPISFVI